MPVVEEIAHMSPICSIMVAREMGTIAMIALSTRPQLGLANTWKAVFSHWKGRPTQAASFTAEKSQIPKQAATRYEPRTPRRMGMILIMPFPQMLQTIIMTIASRAIHQLLLQFWIALPESVRPIAMMIGPVTIGGKKRITFFAPNAAMSPARMK